MSYIRVGEKLISIDRIMHTVEKVLERRATGMSQQDVANELQLDRSFISRLETIGELRKGGRIALVGFPVRNKQELHDVACEFGVDYVFLLNDEERWKWVRETTGAELLNELMELVANVRSHDSVIMIGSDMRIKLTEALVDKQIIPILIGETPIREDKYVDPQELRAILTGLVN